MLKKRRIVALIQARVSSARLPKKHFRKIGKKDVIEWILAKLSKLDWLDDMVISTCSEDGSELYDQYHDHYDYQLFSFQGDVNDVVRRHYQATEKHPADYYLLISGDCPLIDKGLIERLANSAVDGDFDRVGSDGPSIHEGIGFYSREWIRHVLSSSKTAAQKENFDYQIEPAEYRQGVVSIAEKFIPNLCRISVDNMADLRFMNALYDKCNDAQLEFTLSNAIDIINENPTLLSYHSHVRQKQVGFQASKFLFLSKVESAVDLLGLQRLIALAQEFNESYHHSIQFLINDNPLAITELIANGYKHDFLVYDRDFTDKLLANPANVIVSNNPSFLDNSPIFSKIKANGKKVFFYDISPISKLADVYLLPNKQENYEDIPNVITGCGVRFINKKIEQSFLVKDNENEKNQDINLGDDIKIKANDFFKQRDAVIDQLLSLL